MCAKCETHVHDTLPTKLPQYFENVHVHFFLHNLHSPD